MRYGNRTPQTQNKNFNPTSEVNDEGTYQTVNKLVATPFAKYPKQLLKNLKKWG